jgi:hypothetical protein
MRMPLRAGFADHGTPGTYLSPTARHSALYLSQWLLEIHVTQTSVIWTSCGNDQAISVMDVVHASSRSRYTNPSRAKSAVGVSVPSVGPYLKGRVGLTAVSPVMVVVSS